MSRKTGGGVVIMLDARQTTELEKLLAARLDVALMIEHAPGGNYRVTFSRLPGEGQQDVEREAHIITLSGTTYPTEVTS